MAAKTTDEGQHGAHPIVLEVRLDQVDDGAVGEFKVTLPGIAQTQELAHFVGRQGRRETINHENVEHDVANFDMKTLKRVGVHRGKLTNTLHGFRDVTLKDQRRPVEHRLGKLNLGLNDPQPVLGQLDVLPYLVFAIPTLVARMHVVIEAGDRTFLCSNTAADEIGSLQDED